MKAHQAQLEEEIRELRSKNAELEDELRSLVSTTDARPDVDALQAELDQARKDADEYRHQLAAAQVDATSATDFATELAANESQIKAGLAENERELAEIKKEMKVAAERAAGELEAGMESKKREVQTLQELVEEAQRGWSDQSALVEELSAAGTVRLSHESQVLQVLY